MSDAQRDPHVLVSARIARHSKMIELPSDVARWGWITILGEAKLQRPAGQFASRKVLDFLAGKYARFVDDWFKAKLLEKGPDGTILVHDWAVHQERVSRSQEWRQSVGLTNGHSSLGDTRGNSGETNGETAGKPLARAAALSQSQSQSSLPSEGGPGGTGLPSLTPAVGAAWQSATGRTPLASGSFAAGYIDDACRRHPERAVLDAIATARQTFGVIPTPQQLAVAVRAFLDPLPDAKRTDAAASEQRERAASRRRTQATLARIHGYGGHAEPDPACHLCEATA